MTSFARPKIQDSGGKSRNFQRVQAQANMAVAFVRAGPLVNQCPLLKKEMGSVVE
jgi:hypothetical protein